ncbi:MAG: prepilin peptidase [Candidatus Aureabacteria bacterium]|nr:prepilin peptidase [Candidatus Auribacterota bacterium]
MNIINIFWPSVLFICGTIVGSFLNVCIYRLPEELSILFPSSHCPNCKAKIKWYNNIPLLSYIILQGKCRNCEKPISPVYFIVELLTGILFLAAFLFSSGAAEVVFRIMFFSLLMIVSFIDLKYFVIPDECNIIGLVFALLFSSFFPHLQGEAKWYLGLYRSFLGAVTGFAILSAVSLAGSKLLKKDAMGFGDVKLIAMIGSFGGVLVVFLSIAISSIVGTVIGGTALLIKSKTWKGKIPFGPYLAIGAVVSILWGNKLVDWYLGLF